MTHNLLENQLKIILELLPLAAFFIGYAKFNLSVATAAAMVASVIQVMGYKLKYGKVPNNHKLAAGMFVVFGTMTLAFNDPIFIKWKPSIVYFLMAGAFLLYPVFKSNYIPEVMLSSIFPLSKKTFKTLNTSWIAFFIAMGIINLYVVYNFSTEVWVYFKIFGTTTITILFTLLQGVYIINKRQIGTKDYAK